LFFLVAAIHLGPFAPHILCDQADKGPAKVEIGIYLLDLYDLDLKFGSFIGDFYLWLRWRGDIDPTKFEFMNGEMLGKDNPDPKKIGNLNYVSYRMRGKFRARLDFKDYPLDRQTLMIEIEDSNLDANKLVYAADVENMSLEKEFYLSGWETAAKPVCETLLYNYETNYGNPERPPGEKATYSRFRMSIPIKHAGSELIYLKTFIGVFISVAIAFLTFLVEPTDLDPRFGVGVAGIFGAVSSMIVVSSNLPENPYFTLADKVHLTSLGFIFLSILISCVVLKIHKHGHTLASRRVDLFAGLMMVAAYVGTVCLLSV